MVESLGRVRRIRVAICIVGVKHKLEDSILGVEPGLPAEKRGLRKVGSRKVFFNQTLEDKATSGCHQRTNWRQSLSLIHFSRGLKGDSPLVRTT